MKKKLEKQEDLFLVDLEEVSKILLTSLKTKKIKAIQDLSSQISKLPKALKKELSQMSERHKTLENYPWQTHFKKLLFFCELGKFGFFLGSVHKKLLVLKDRDGMAKLMKQKTKKSNTKKKEAKTPQ